MPETSSRILPDLGALERARNTLKTTLPQHGLGSESIAPHLRDIGAGLNLASSPNYYGFITGGVTPAALIADKVVSEFDQNVQVHLPGETIATDVEDCALKLLCELFYFDPDRWQHRIFTTGATASNVLGLACGREHIVSRARTPRDSALEASVGELGIVAAMRRAGLEDIQILTTVPHSSLSKAASIVGLGRASVKVIGQHDAPHRFDYDKLLQCLEDRNVGYVVAVSSGEVNTGRFATEGYDEMKQLRQLCDRYNAWLHVDAAFGLLARAISGPEFEAIIRKCAGLELADSVAGDAHKLLNVPYDCGFFFSRSGDIAEQVFRNANAAYLQREQPARASIASPLNMGLENSRRFRALPVYATLVAYGREGYQNMLERQIRLARAIATFILEHPGFVLLPKSTLTKSERLADIYMIVLFRAKADDLNRHLVQQINKTSKIYVSGTVWDGAPACRFAVANWGVDVERDLQRISEVLSDVVTDQTYS